MNLQMSSGSRRLDVLTFMRSLSSKGSLSKACLSPLGTVCKHTRTAKKCTVAEAAVSGDIVDETASCKPRASARRVHK